MCKKLDKLKGVKEKPFVLTIAGFDPCSGAGLTADVKTFESHCVYGVAVVTSITVQNDISFTNNSWVDQSLIFEQINTLFSRFEIEVVKIGLIESIEFLNKVVSHLLILNPEVRIIWDPVIRASAGYKIHNSIDYKILNLVLKKIYLVTPNLDEFNILFPEIKAAENYDFMDLNEFIKKNNYSNILLKDAVDSERFSCDYLILKGVFYINKVERTITDGKHGTGCILSSSICSFLALNKSIKESCEMAQKYISEIINFNKELLSIHNK